MPHNMGHKTVSDEVSPVLYGFFSPIRGGKNQRLVDMMLVIYKINNKISHLTYYVGLILHPVI
jgi:hypothetical protein